MACLAVWAGGALGAEFCVSNETDLQAALDIAGGNGEDDVIKVQQGTYRGNFSYTGWGTASPCLVAIHRVVLRGILTRQTLYLMLKVQVVCLFSLIKMVAI